MLLPSVRVEAAVLCENGRARYTIVVPKDAIPAERTAAEELQTYLKRVSGCDFPIEQEQVGASLLPQIHVGPTTRALSEMKTTGALEQDAIFIKTLPDTLILAGGRPRGTLYAVYTFLEDTIGVKWWTSTESTIPRRPRLEIPEIDIQYAPKLRYRESYHYDPIHNPRFAARLKLNGHMAKIPEALGGHYTLLGWCHTSYALLPSQTYFSAHPEWYSLQNGKRDPNGGQLCWTNREMQSELARNALAWIDKNTTAGIISISQNDHHGPCACDVCSKLVAEEGSQAGPLIAGVNAVAAEIARKYPDFLIETLAYQYTRKPPKNIRPADNVLVRLCSIEANVAQPLDSQANASFRDDLLGWKAISKNLFIWNYVTSFGNYLIPHPNMLPLGKDLQFFANNNVIGVFEQGDAYNRLAGDFLPLRNWLLAHLMWDPSRDQQQLRDEFLRGYYGAAGSFLGQYLDLVNAPARSPGFSVGCYNTNTAFLTDETITRAAELFDKAEKAVRDRPKLAFRVRRDRTALDHLQLLRFNFDAAVSKAKGDPDKVCGTYDKDVAEFIETAVKMGVRNFSEGQSFDSYAPSLKARCMRYIPPQLPAPGTVLPRGRHDIQEDAFTLIRPGEWAKNVDDPKASNGKAAMMSGNHTNWAVQYHISKDSPIRRKGPWRCYIVARCKPKSKSGPAFWYGLHETAGNQYIARDAASFDLAGDGEYHSYGIFVDELKPGMYFWVSPPGNVNAVESITIDRIYLERVNR